MAATRQFYSPKPCEVGDPVSNIDTPALVVCLDSLSHNLAELPRLLQQFPSVSFRPHCKTHKSPDIARMQIASGAVGVCCQTVTEAEAMADGGVPDVFISNQVVDDKKLKRLPALSKKTKLSLCVDNPDNVRQIDALGQAEGIVLDLCVEVCVGMPRCGLPPGDDVISLVRLIQSLGHVNFKGLHCYNGVNQHVPDYTTRTSAVSDVVATVRQLLQSMKSSGLECNYVTGGGTGTFMFEAGSGLFTEIQAGSYVMMDVDYLKNKTQEGQLVSDFRSSLFVLGTVISVQKDRAVVNVGMKAVSHDSGPPMIRDRPDLTCVNGGDEHCVVSPPQDLKLGQKVWLVPGHCDPTVNMHEWLVGVREGRVESVWPVSGRGAGL